MKMITDKRALSGMAREGLRTRARMDDVELKTGTMMDRSDSDRGRVAALEAALIALEARVAALERS